MKRLISFLFCFVFIFSFVACSKTSKEASATNADLLVTQELEEIEGVDNFDDETIKALSVIIRTKHKNSKTKTSKEYTPKNEHIYNIVKETTGEVLENQSEVDYYKNEDWVVEIKNFEILKTLSKHGISLSSLSGIEPVFNEDGTLSGINIGSKFISYKTIKKELNLPSNKITNIQETDSGIKIFGTGHENKASIEKVNELSKKGNNYKQIIKYFYGDF